MSSEALPQAAPHPVLAEIAAEIGEAHVLVDEQARRFHSSDIYAVGELPLAVVRPADTDGVAAIARFAARHGLSLVPRGGGVSYTDGYLPTESASLLVDAARLERILEINEEDMYVTVQAGVTWAQLNDALRPLGLRTPFFGPFSGARATVGGSVSQHSVSWGTGIFGASADSVLSVEVVLSGGEVLRTGSWGTDTSTPFFRHFGPDLTGLFAGDAGALGIKTAITLRLLARPPEFIGLSFRFPDFDAMFAGMHAVAKLGINTVNFGLDPRLQQGALGRMATRDALAAARSVFATARNPLDGIVQVVRMGLAGRRFVSADEYALHYVVEGVDRAAAKAAAAAVRRAVAPYGAEMANTVPNVMYANPYPPFTNIVGPRGERWAPIHGLLPFSRVTPFRRALEALLAGHDDAMREHGIEIGNMFMSVSTNGFIYEPVFYWPDAHNDAVRGIVPEGYLDQVGEHPASPEGRALVHAIKLEIIDLLHRHGAVHFQVGKLYPYLVDRNPAAERLVRDIKKALDPDRKMNPGALGL